MKRLLICFDVDGTLIDDTVFIWETIHKKLKTDTQERRFWTNAFWNKEISYEEWARKDIEMWRRKGADRETLLSAIESLRLMSGAMRVLSTLKQNHFLGIISGSIDIALDKSIPEWKNIFDVVYLNILKFDDRGRLTDIIPTPFDIERKADGLMCMAEALNVPLKSTVFVGDNYNDISVAQTAGCSIAFNCKSETLASVSDYVVPGTDLQKILPIIDQFAHQT